MCRILRIKEGVKKTQAFNQLTKPITITKKIRIDTKLPNSPNYHIDIRFNFPQEVNLHQYYRISNIWPNLPILLIPLRLWCRNNYPKGGSKISQP